jgi:ERCC4-type nuclease
MMNEKNSDHDSHAASGMGGWHVVLLVDSNERCHRTVKFMTKHELVDTINKQFGSSSDGAFIPHCETQRLLAGDYLWVARHSSTGEERLLNCIMERKSFPDLTMSLTTKSTKYHPLSRMDVQLKKLQASTLPHRLLIVEKGERSFLSPSCILVANQFLTNMAKKGKQKKKDVNTISLRHTKSVSDTLQFLLYQHEQMRHKMRRAYQSACAESPDNISSAMVKMEPFASDNVTTIDQLNQTIQMALEDPHFQYYLTLRRVIKMGESKAQAILKRYPQRQDLCDYLVSVTTKEAVKELVKLPFVGKTLATRIHQAFFLPPLSAQKSKDAKPAAGVVTPPATSKRCSTAVVTPPSTAKRSTTASSNIRKTACNSTPDLSTREMQAFLESSDSSDNEELFHNPFERPTKRHCPLFEDGVSLNSNTRLNAETKAIASTTTGRYELSESADSSINNDQPFQNPSERGPNNRQRRLFDDVPNKLETSNNISDNGELLHNSHEPPNERQRCLLKEFKEVIEID